MKQLPIHQPPYMSDEGFEMQYIQEAFNINWIAPLGSNVTGFENEFAAKVGSKAALATTTGTAAIHLALKAVGVKEGDIFFCQSLTFSATANPIIYEKATPVFIDSDRETWNMDPMHMQPFFEKYDYIGGDVSRKLFENGVCLPSDTKMTDGDLNRICSIIKRLW